MKVKADRVKVCFWFTDNSFGKCPQRVEGRIQVSPALTRAWIPFLRAPLWRSNCLQRPCPLTLGLRISAYEAEVTSTETTAGLKSCLL